MRNCYNDALSNGPILQKTFVAFLLLKGCLGTFIFPSLLKELSGHSKLYFLLQQLMIFLFLGSTFAPALTVYNMLEGFMHKFDWNMDDIMFVQPLCLFFNNVCYYLQYAFSFLQMLNYQAMICNPLSYQEYILPKNFFRRGAVVFIASLIIPAPLLSLLVVSVHTKNFNVLRWVLNVFHLTVFLVYRMIYSFSIVVIARKIKNALNESKRTRNGHDSNSSLFIVICIVPLINNFIYLAADIPYLVSPFYHSRSTCNDLFGYFSAQVCLPLMAGTYMVGSMLQCGSYLVYIPNLRISACKRAASFASRICTTK